ncbi:hypothetical protein [Streptomyces albipurpureus]|uniref:Uncharacterized protein n=1 Tax=Streptomyces albipurpureus TaxID=2897419 RepID=A0ABT0UJ03_9ACTN|nr:hypothetical protein [Streptomyces sp. CWNU-1]MCM2388217.1 hypothetical protein [Streptomyces sp. CWNU-1]
MTAESVSTRSLYVHGLKGNVWLDNGVIVLQQDGLRRRIPLAAVHGVEVSVGRYKRPAVEITLRTGEGSEPVRYELDGRSFVTANLFAETVTAALPAAHAAHPMDNGTELVVEEADPQARQRTAEQQRQGRRLVIVLVTCLVLWVAGLVTVAVAGESDSLTFWLAGTAPLLGGLGLVAGLVFTVRGWVIRRRRGVGVVAVFDRREGRHKVFVFIDNAGERQEYNANPTVRTIAEDPPRIQVIHDPLGRVGAQPYESVAALVARCTFYTVIGLPLLAGGLYALPYQLARVLFPSD